MRALLKFATVIDGIGRLARAAEWAHDTASILTGAPHDARGTKNARNADLSTSSKVEYGYIVDAVPGIREYRVQPEAGGPLIECTSLMHGTSGPTGVYDGSTYGIGCHVRYIRHRQTPLSGTIIGAEPCYHYDPRLMYSDIVSQGSNVGVHLESGFQALLKLGGAIGDIVLNGGFINYGGRTPWDSVEIGDMNWSAETGLMLHMDPCMTFLRADEMTGFWAFYWDGLARIAGQQLEEITSVSTRHVYDDEGEASVFHGVAPYPWEALGLLHGPTSEGHTEYSEASEIQTDKPWYSRVEPKYDDQQAFYRFQTYGGYLGQHEKKLVCAPRQKGEPGSSSSSMATTSALDLTPEQAELHDPSGYYRSWDPSCLNGKKGVPVQLTTAGGPMDSASANEATVLRYQDSYCAPGLYDQQVTMAGHMFVRTALGITIAKRPIIPVPKRVKIVTDEKAGDTSANYKAASKYGTGDDHKVQPSPTMPRIGDNEKMVYAATAVLDLHAHMFNWEGLHPFYYHKNDYYLPEESEYDLIYTNQDIPQWGELDNRGRWYLSPARVEQIKIDHRPGNVANVYRNTSYITLLDNGGVLIGGGCGEEIRMVGGNIFLACPGDVFMEAGRNITSWAGRDAIMRAWNSIDITANGGADHDRGGDVRIKAERNMQLLSANGGGLHGTFIECRSEGDAQYDFTEPGEKTKHAGIIIQAIGTEICEYADSIYLRTCIQDPQKFNGFKGAHAIRKVGDITLDTYGCCGDITTRSNNVKHWVCCSIMHSFDPAAAADNSQGVNIFTKDGEVLCNDLYVDGSIVAWKDIVAADDVVATDGNVYSGTSCGVNKLTSGAKSSIDAAWQAGHSHEVDLKTIADNQYKIDFKQMWYAEGRPGNAKTIASEWVSLRVDNDYKAQGFRLYETRWAQMANSGPTHKAPKTWTENPVESNRKQGHEKLTYPFPGIHRLVEKDDTYKQHDFLLYDTENQWAKDRGSDYESKVTLNKPTGKKLDGNYPIIGK
jgi:hypothetical protein